MPPKNKRPVVRASHGRSKCVSSGTSTLEPTPSLVKNTPVKNDPFVGTDMPTVSTAALSLSKSSFGTPSSSEGTKMSFMDVFVVEMEDGNEKFIKEFDCWLNYIELVLAVKHIFPKMSMSKIHTMSHNDLVNYLMLSNKIEDLKPV